jgi:DNA invertase Pin-like site-specific DNA recombinase
VRFGYARVSTEDQSLNLQLDALRAAGCTRIFTDKLSGKSRKRAGLDDALAALNMGDQIVVWRLDRLGRNFRHLVDIADELRERGVNLISISEGIDTSSNVGEIIFRLMSVFSDFERNVIVERTRAGLAAAKARGVKLGRSPVMDAERLREARRLIRFGMTTRDAAQRIGVGRSTLYRCIKTEKSGVVVLNEKM